MAVSPITNKIYISNHGAKGGDFFGEVKYAENYGWKLIGWEEPTTLEQKLRWKCLETRFYKPLWTWTPSIAVSNIIIYDGEEFPAWKGDVLVTSLKFKTLYKLNFENDIVSAQEVIFEDRIGRIRDLEVNSKGELFLIDSSGSASLWQLKDNGGNYE